MISLDVNPMNIETYKPTIYFILFNKNKSRLVIELDLIIIYIKAPKL